VEEAPARAASGRSRRVALVVTAVVLVGLVAALVLGAGDDHGDAGELDNGVPRATDGQGNVADVSFTRFDGSDGSFGDYEGRPLVVNFFAEWCTPCVKEMPAVERVHQRYRDEVAFVGMNLRDPIEDGRDVARRTGVTYDLARDPDGRIYERFTNTGVMPVTALVDEHGNLVEVRHGELSEAELVELVREKLLS
jgi:cytochrome c biogenesis protein CcmG, thiol:disulfide interchange protein DsbE